MIKEGLCFVRFIQSFKRGIKGVVDQQWLLVDVFESYGQALQIRKETP